MIVTRRSSERDPASAGTVRWEAIRSSVVIPKLDEAEIIVVTLRRLATQGADEAVVVDGGSDDGTHALARDKGVRVVEMPLGRETQQNRGAAATTDGVLIFLHADGWLDPGALATRRRFLVIHRGRVVLSSACIHVSPKRCRHQGIIRQILRND